MKPQDDIDSNQHKYYLRLVLGQKQKTNTLSTKQHRYAQNDTWYDLDRGARGERKSLKKKLKKFPIQYHSQQDCGDEEKINPNPKTTTTMKRGHWRRSFGNKSISYANASTKWIKKKRTHTHAVIRRKCCFYLGIVWRSQFDVKCLPTSIIHFLVSAFNSHRMRFAALFSFFLSQAHEEYKLCVCVWTSSLTHFYNVKVLFIHTNTLTDTRLMPSFQGRC